VQKSVENTGSQKIYLVSEKITMSVSLNVSVETVVTELNALNGESKRKDLEYGAVLQDMTV